MRKDEKFNAGISELIGAILLVGLVITAMAIVAVVVLSNPPPEEIPHLSALASNTSNAILLYHNGGDELKEDLTIVSINNGPEVPHSKITLRNEDGTSESATWDITKTPWTMGKALVIDTTPDLPQSVTIVYKGTTSQQLILTTSFIPGTGIGRPTTTATQTTHTTVPTTSPTPTPTTTGSPTATPTLTPTATPTPTTNTTVPTTSPTPTPTTTGSPTATPTLTPTATPTPIPTPLCGTISGTKYKDLNGNGNLDPGEPGLAGWTMQCFNRQQGNWVLIKTTTTNATGYYIFTGLDYLQSSEDYQIREIIPAGWVAVDPPQGISRSYTLNQPHCYETGVNFGNRQVLPPIADFTASPTSGYAPLTVQFTDTSTGNPAQWQWDVNNDGVVDYTVQNPIHTYSSPGTYSVRLTVSNPGGSDTRIKTGYITVNAPPTTNIYLVANKDGSLQQGGYMQFRVTGPYSYIRHGNTYYNLNIGDIVRLEITSDGTGNIYATSSTVNNFRFNNVRLTLNGVDKGTKDIEGGDIWISGYDSYLSTLTLIVPAKKEWTQLNVNGVSIIYGTDSREIRIFNLRPDTWGVMNLNTRNDVYYDGGATGYQLT
ncbi:MAG: PKD domain-containing protein [Methanolinea sp.]|jgi:PKD repeat protein|nr:PKD domain-containing protein [Methanolinea sp.]